MRRVDGDTGEHRLTGGNVGDAVMRVGDTVRRPAGPWSVSVDAFLRHLNDVGYEGAPRTFGFDDQGRHVLEYVDGSVPMPFEPPEPLTAARRVGAMIRDFHDASAEFVMPADAPWNVVITPDSEDLVVHHDLGPWNLVCGPTRWVFVDWDNAGPGSRLWDLAYAAHGFIPLEQARDATASDAAHRLAALVDGYRLDELGRTALLDLLPRRAMSMHDLLRRGSESRQQPWSQLWEAGHGAVWRAKATYASRNHEALRRALLP